MEMSSEIIFKHSKMMEPSRSMLCRPKERTWRTVWGRLETWRMINSSILGSNSINRQCLYTLGMINRTNLKLVYQWTLISQSKETGWLQQEMEWKIQIMYISTNLLYMTLILKWLRAIINIFTTLIKERPNTIWTYLIKSI